MAESHIDLASTLLLYRSNFYFLRASHACSISGRTGTAGRENAFTTGVSTAVIVMLPHLAGSMPMSNAWSQSTSHGPRYALRILAWPPCPARTTRLQPSACHCSLPTLRVRARFAHHRVARHHAVPDLATRLFKLAVGLTHPRPSTTLTLHFVHCRSSARKQGPHRKFEPSNRTPGTASADGESRRKLWKQSGGPPGGTHIAFLRTR
jgi:hypothetical protein